MRKITQNSVNAFLQGNDFSTGNMSVIKTAENESCLYLHGNLIAIKNLKTGRIFATLAGWGTPTTRERINGVLSLTNSRFRVAQNNFKQVLYNFTNKTETVISVKAWFDTYTGKVLDFDWKRVDSDINGNPRYVCHFLNVILDDYKPLDNQYEQAVKIANMIGGRKFHNKQYGGGLVFQSYSLPDTEEHLRHAMLNQ